jgi:hypothetical protein
MHCTHILTARFRAVDIKIAAGEAGLEDDHPIVLDDEEPQASSQAGPSRAGRQGSVKSEPTGSTRPLGHGAANIVDEIAETQVRVSGVWLSLPVTYRVFDFRKSSKN